MVRQAHHDNALGHHDTENAAGTNAIRVVTTFSTLNSFVEAVGGSYVTVHNLVPIGASPETYQPTPQDIATLADAQLLVENGTGIEAWLQHTISTASNPNLRILILSDGLKHIDHNPHLWMDPVLASLYVGKVARALSLMDPPHTSDYQRNAAAYQQRLVALQNEIAKSIATLPPQRRTMIVFHNAWQYYNDRFGIRTVGIIELSPGQEPNPSYIANLVDLSRTYNVRAVFSEPEYSPKIAQTLAKSAGIRTVSDLYDDSIANNAHVHDYISMLRYDTDVIVKALK
ncbi:MAG TPA: metal ABC transporter substrate-binding protein [Candidatus Rubrimentiphilum sp.]|nr:metal ABC transporter substrate-binding protein [Candidatus Rubrimentiphilum sp.]